MMRTAAVLLVSALLGASVLAGCARDVAEEPAAPPTAAPQPAPAPEAPPAPDPAAPPGDEAASAFPWLDVELEDVQTAERFRIADFAGRPVLVKTFAVW